MASDALRASDAGGGGACLGISAAEDRIWAGLIVEDAETVDSGDMKPRMASNGQGGGAW